MKAQFSKENLLHALQKVRGVIDEQTPLPILSNVLLEARDGKSRITGTNLEIRISVSVPSSVSDKGDVAIPAKTLADLVQRVSDPEASITLSGDLQKGQIHLATIGRQKFSANLPGLSKDDFTKPVKLEGEIKFSVKGQTLITALKQASIAVSADDSRRYLTGVLFDIEGSDLKLVATDSHRLAFVRIPVDGKCPKREFLLPSRSVQELIRCMPADDTNISVSFTDRVTVFSCDGVILQSQLISEKFPNYAQVIPKEFETDIRANTRELIDALRIVSVFTDGDNPRVTFKADSSNQTLKISTVSQDRGSGDATIPGKYSGSPIELGFNVYYCMDALNQILTEDVQIRVITPKNPCVFRSPGDDNHLHVIMPMRIS